MTDDDKAGFAGADTSDYNAADSAAYFARRAAWHESRAAVSSDDATRALHRRFATLYRDRSQA